MAILTIIGIQIEWQKIHAPDVLMLPIRGEMVHNTMDEQDALQAIRIIKPKLVIPCHYNCPAFFTKKYNLADDNMFKREVEKMGIDCAILTKGDSIELKNDE